MDTHNFIGVTIAMPASLEGIGYLMEGFGGVVSGREIARSALSLARSAQAERDNESCFFPWRRWLTRKWTHRLLFSQTGIVMKSRKVSLQEGSVGIRERGNTSRHLELVNGLFNFASDPRQCGRSKQSKACQRS
ncbi:hypothetical protein EVAR_12192_1 [Eumeta japonica]|uniref:Uncharacterized protein n=1 Tax=Eumeta variegata TaxID=151549 RepID=A0A4C1UGW0_EUMVA|nr:hypothetical protein EVAR_12192_1 [Eumeta japonica]